MANPIKDKMLLLLGFLLSLLLILLANVLSWLNDDFYKSLELTIPYKWMLTILLMLIIIIIFAWFYSLTFKNSSRKPSKRELKHLYHTKIEIIKNLDADEKNILKQFKKKNTQTLEADFFDKTVLNLKSKGILIQLSDIGKIPMHAPYKIEDSYWEIIKNNNLID